MNKNILFNNISQYGEGYYISESNNEVLFQVSKSGKITEEFYIDNKITSDTIILVKRIDGWDKTSLYAILTDTLLYIINAEGETISISKYDLDIDSISDILSNGVLKTDISGAIQYIILGVSNSGSQNIFDLLPSINLKDKIFIKLGDIITLGIVGTENLDVEYHLGVLNYQSYYAKTDKFQEFIILDDIIYYDSFNKGLINITNEFEFISNTFFNILSSYDNPNLVRFNYINQYKQFSLILEDKKEVILAFINAEDYTFGTKILQDEENNLTVLNYKTGEGINDITQLLFMNNFRDSNDRVKKKLTIGNYTTDINNNLIYDIIDEEYTFKYLNRNYSFHASENNEDYNTVLYHIINDMSEYGIRANNKDRLLEIKKYINANKGDLVYSLPINEYSNQIYITNIQDNTLNIIFMNNVEYGDETIIYFYQDVLIGNTIENTDIYSFSKSKYNTNLTIIKDGSLCGLKAIDMDTVYFYDSSQSILSDDDMAVIYSNDGKDISSNIINMVDGSQILLMSYYEYQNNVTQNGVMEAAKYINKLIAIKIIQNEVIDIVTEQDLIERGLLESNYFKDRENLYNHYILNDISLGIASKKFFGKNEFNFISNSTSTDIFENVDSIYFGNISYLPEETYRGYGLFNKDEFITNNRNIVNEEEYSEIIPFTNSDNVLYID